MQGCGGPDEERGARRTRAVDAVPESATPRKEQKRQGALWSQRNLYRDVIEPAREAAGTAFTLYDARHTFVSTLMAAGVPVPEVAAYSGHS
jgi:integrase